MGMPASFFLNVSEGALWWLMLEIAIPQVDAVRHPGITDWEKKWDHTPPLTHFTDEDTEAHLGLRSDLHLNNRPFVPPAVVFQSWVGISRNLPQPPTGCWDSILGIPTFLGNIMLPQSAYIPNPPISPYLSYLTGSEISTPPGLEFPPSFATGIPPQGTQQKSVCRDPSATPTPESCFHSSPVLPT